ncbi:MAG: Fe-S protein assembly co-chaperone HscB [Neisseriaceae bacterium]|nr:Fe-S protein assembly co-chaperone HscB [Neisseriaceae bacterium]
MNDFFALFHLPQDYAIDLAVLEQTYRVLAAQYHPDRAAGQSAFHQKENMMMTASINQAYGVLRDDIERGVHMLALHGIDANAHEYNIADPEFLMQQMEWREDLENAQTLDEVNKLNQQIQEVKCDVQQQLLAEFHNQNYPNATQTLQRLRFVHKLLTAIDEKRERMA